MIVDAWKAREIPAAETGGQRDPAGADPGAVRHDADLDSAAWDLSWQYATPEEQWALITRENR